MEKRTMHKEKYILADMQIIEFENEDVITTSAGGGSGSGGDEPDMPFIPDPDAPNPDNPDPDNPNPDNPDPDNPDDPSLSEDVGLSDNELEIV